MANLPPTPEAYAVPAQEFRDTVGPQEENGRPVMSESQVQAIHGVSRYVALASEVVPILLRFKPNLLDSAHGTGHGSVASGLKRQREDQEDTASADNAAAPCKRQKTSYINKEPLLKDCFRGPQNDWWRGLGPNWSNADAKALKIKISGNKSVKRTLSSLSQEGEEASPSEPTTTPSPPLKRGRGRPRTSDNNKKRVYCPRCIWRKHHTSSTGRRGRKGNARHGCRWCTIWTKEANDTDYVLTEEEEEIVAAEDEDFVSNVLVIDIARTSVLAGSEDEVEEEAKSAEQAHQTEVAQEAEEEEVVSEEE